MMRALPLIRVASVFVCLLCLEATESRAQACQPYTIGLDASYAQALESSIALGKAMGQTFLATDTLIESIMVWRQGTPDPEGEGWHLFIVGTDSQGNPNVGNVVLDGPTIFSSGVDTHDVPLTYQFSPPVALPHPGTYEIAFLGVPCDGTIMLAINLNNPYPAGEFWLHGRSAFSGCSVRPGPMSVPSWDMIFQIEFCAFPVPTLPATWGRMKARYR